MKSRPLARKVKNGNNSAETTEETASEMCTSACLSVLDSFLMFDQRLTTHLAVCATADSPYGSLRPLMKILEISCHGIPWLIGSAFLFLCSHRAEDVMNYVNLTFALLFDAVMVGLLKLCVRRSRPSHNVSDMFAAPSVDKYSFPSGHATRSAMVAMFLCRHIFTSYLYRATVWVWACAVCASRILLGRHHILDVACGFTFGISFYFCYVYFWVSKDLCMYYLDTYFGHVHL